MSTPAPAAPPTWDLSEFAKLVTDKIGPTHCDAMLPALNSIHPKLERSRSHSTLALGLMAPHKGSVSNDPIHQAIEGMRMLTVANEQSAKFVESLTQASDHTVAFAQSLHATADYLAKAIYLGFDMRGRHGATLSDTQVGLKNVAKKMETRPALAPVRVAIVNYLTSPAFVYLSAYVNTEKHHLAVSTSYSLSMSVNAVSSGGLQLEGFTYSGATYPKKWASELFENAFSEILAHTIGVGRAASDYLRGLPDLAPLAPVAAATV